MKKIAEDIRNRQFHKLYLLFGEEAYLRGKYAASMKKALSDFAGDLNYTLLQGKNADISTIVEASQTLPFFSEKKVVIAEDSGLFKEKSDRCADYFPEIPDTTTLVFIESEVDKRNRSYKAALKYGYVCEFKKPGAKELEDYVLSVIGRWHLTIRKPTMNYFLGFLNEDLGEAENETEKLCAYVYGRKEITKEDIDAICIHKTENRIFLMIELLSAGKKEKALEEYKNLLADKEPPMKILFLMTKQFDNMLRIKMLKQEDMSETLICETTKIHPYAVKKMLPLLNRYSVQQLGSIVERFVRAEEQIKTGLITDALCVEMLLVDCVK